MGSSLITCACAFRVTIPLPITRATTTHTLRRCPQLYAYKIKISKISTHHDNIETVAPSAMPNLPWLQSARHPAF